MASAQVEEKSDGRFADLLDAVVGHIGDSDPVLACGLQIDHIHADPIARDDLAAGHRLDHFAVDRGPLHDQPIGVGHMGDQGLWVFCLKADKVNVQPRAQEHCGLWAVVWIAEIGQDNFE